MFSATFLKLGLEKADSQFLTLHVWNLSRKLGAGRATGLWMTLSIALQLNRQKRIDRLFASISDPFILFFNQHKEMGWTKRNKTEKYRKRVTFVERYRVPNTHAEHTRSRNSPLPYVVWGVRGHVWLPMNKTPTRHPHRQTHSVFWVFFQRKYFTHHIQIKRKSNKCPLLLLKDPTKYFL